MGENNATNFEFQKITTKSFKLFFGGMWVNHGPRVVTGQPNKKINHPNQSHSPRISFEKDHDFQKVPKNSRSLAYFLMWGGASNRRVIFTLIPPVNYPFEGQPGNYS